MRVKTLLSIAILLIFVAGIQITFAEDDNLPPIGCEGERPYGTGTPGYWKNHDWPTVGINTNADWWPRDDAIEIMEEPVKGDKTLTMFPAYVAAKLNLWHDFCNAYRCIRYELECAAEWLDTYPPRYGVRANSDAWQRGWEEGFGWCPSGEELYLRLDAYNNGLLCERSRDYYEDE